MTFNLGDHINMSGNWNFPNSATGVVAKYPQYVTDACGEEGSKDGFTRQVRGKNGPVTFVWIKFDEPQMDSDGDGPYREGEVELEFVSHIECGAI
ncbi:MULTISPECIES: hypothetical protein [Microbulbifer]|uniref:hypothetical protein n=1 Tax=Microbulbifer TaxID=48073 RepID=UPI001143F9BE|nr:MULTISPECIES: hypothetical protein [Microbulbifer]